jgi:hypothetical protein
MVNKPLIGVLYFGCNRGLFHDQRGNRVSFVVFFKAYFTAFQPLIIAAKKSGLMLTVEFPCLKDGIVEVEKRMGMPDKDIAVNTFILFKIYPEF